METILFFKFPAAPTQEYIDLEKSFPKVETIQILLKLAGAVWFKEL